MLADGEGLGSGEVLEVLEGCAEGDASSLAVPLSLCDFASSDVVPWVLESVLGEGGWLRRFGWHLCFGRRV